MNPEEMAEIRRQMAAANPEERTALFNDLFKFGDEEARARMLKPLLRWLKAEKKGFIPDECFREFYDIGVTPFFELVYYRYKRDYFNEGYQYLLARRDDRWWSGFHVMGRKLEPSLPADPFGICEILTGEEHREHGKQEGLRVKSVRLVSALHWKEHPWCHPLAIVCLVETEGEIIERDDFGFFWLDGLPSPMVPNHEPYLHQCDYVRRTGRALVFTAQDRFGLTNSSPDIGDVELLR